MLDSLKLNEVDKKLVRLLDDLSWVKRRSTSSGYNLNIMAVKALLLQIKSIESILEELVNKEEEI